MEQKQKTEQFKGQTGLPKFAVPKRYDLRLKTDPSDGSFSGAVKIDLSIVEVTNFIVLNALELDIHEVGFTDSENQKFGPSDLVLHGDDEILVLVFDQALSICEGALEIGFSGTLNNHLRGFYKCTQVDGVVKTNMAVTQFEAVDARRCFPCWDEPALKATFKITLDMPSELMALSSMPIIDEKLNGNFKTVCFKESPVMSTYLVAFVIGLFDYIEDTTDEGIKVRVYSPVGKSDKGRFSLNIAMKVLDLFARYFSMRYPLPKLDMVAVPQFSGGAMENYGLIIYRENLLLHDDLHTSAAKKQILTTVVAHEVAHQWFGNLVTMDWWSDLWLNEGFATWVSYTATDQLFPEWKIWNQFVQQSAGGLRIDALDQSHPIEMEIHSARSVEEKFDAISYKKGSAVIRMLEVYLGDVIFQNSLRKYISRYAWKNARTDDLWSVLSEESGTQVDLVMNTWTKQKGYPVVSVKLEGHLLEFEQSMFLSSGLHSDGQWSIPITFSVGSYNNCRNFLLEKQSDVLDISDLMHSPNDKFISLGKEIQGTREEYLWVKVNIGQSGFYRVKYEEKLAARLIKAMKNNSLSETDKFGILDDTYALCEASQQSLSSLLSLVDVYRKEVDYVVCSRLIDICNSILKISTEAVPDLVAELKQYFINILQFSAQSLGWDPKPGDHHFVTLLRGEVFKALANFGDDKVQKEGLQRFQAIVSNRSSALLSADMKGAAYVAMIRNASTTNRSAFESLLKIFREAESAEEKEQILRYVASSPDPELVLEALHFLVSDEVREQDVVYGLAGISFEGRETAWQWLKENWDLIISKYGAALLLSHFIRDIVTPFCSNEKADEIEAFFANRKYISMEMNLKQSIEQVRNKARWVEHIKQEQSLRDLVRELARRN